MKRTVLELSRMLASRERKCRELRKTLRVQADIIHEQDREIQSYNEELRAWGGRLMQLRGVLPRELRAKFDKIVGTRKK